MRLVSLDGRVRPIAIVLLEVASGMVQYQAGLCGTCEIRPKAASRSITYLTLIGGFASRSSGRLPQPLESFFSWREIYIAYAALNLLVCLPLHRWIMRKPDVCSIESAGLDREAIAGALSGHRPRRRGMLLVSFSL